MNGPAILLTARLRGLRANMPRERVLESGMTFLAQILALAGSMAALFLAGRMLPAPDFASYQVARRILSIITYPVLLGVGIGIPRYAAKSDTPQVYLAAGFLLTLPLLALTCSVFLLAPAWFAQLFFGDSSLARLTGPIILMVAGLYLHTITYAYFRGIFRMPMANTLTICNQFAAVVVAIVFCGHALNRLLTLTGLAWVIISLFFLWRGSGRNFFSLPIGKIKSAVKALAIFGLPRGPGEFALFGLFALPVFLLSHRLGPEQAGMFSFGISIMLLLASFFDFAGILILPHLSRRMRTSGFQQTAILANTIMIITVSCSIVITFFAVLLLQYPIAWSMGAKYIPAVAGTRILILASPAYIAFAIQRNALDAISVFPFNMINLILALVAICGAIQYFGEYISPEVAVVLGIYFLAGISCLCFNLLARRLHKTHENNL